MFFYLEKKLNFYGHFGDRIILTVDNILDKVGVKINKSVFFTQLSFLTVLKSH